MAKHEIKLGIYCSADEEITSALDMEALEKVALGESKAIVWKTHKKITSPEGEALIKKDIEEHGLDRIVVLDRSQRANPDMFNFGDNIFVEQVPFRELVVWTHEPNDEDTQMLAEDYLRMFAAKMGSVKPAEAAEYEGDMSRKILVIGGGVSGLRTALQSAKCGFEVELVEKEDHLGGHAARWKTTFPTKEPYTKIVDNNIDELIGEVDAHDKINVHLSTKVKRISGAPGFFQATLKNGTVAEPIQIGSIVQATGWKPYNAKKLGHLGYGVKNVITNIQMEDMIAKDAIVRPSDNKAPESIAFIQCAGSRDKEHLPYCSAVCCRVSLKHAMLVREKYPDTKIFVIYKDIRSPGQYELFYQNAQNDPAFFFTKGEVAEVKELANGGLIIDVDETLLGEAISIEADMLVLATGMVPTTLVEDTVMDVGEETPADAPVEEEEDLNDGKKASSSAEVGARILNLTYRQGSDLPTLKYGFPDSHFICFPYETRRTAIFAAGTVRAPMDIAQATTDANGAALKAVQAINMLDKGMGLHPRSRDLSFPDFFLQRCTQCKRCTEDCPFGALDEDEKGTPKPNTTRCRRCGTCMGACPERIINFDNFSVPMGNAMIKAIEVPEELEEKPRIIAFMCENDALPALEAAAAKRLKFNPWVRIIPVRCLGSVNLVWITNCLDNGMDGIMMLGCKHGDDYQCHFVKGSELAQYRMGNAQEKLQQMALEEERVIVDSIAIDEWEKAIKVIEDYSEVIEEIGANPFKDF
ncbi:hydrogenase iron-sulfur subunit [bacterium]|nr:hydrogenase iron-sulfur subunit [bacterium]